VTDAMNNINIYIGQSIGKGQKLEMPKANNEWSLD